MKKEEWFYNKGYRVTEFGNIVNPSGIVLRPSDNGRGYLFTATKRNKKHCKIGVHRLQAFQKYGQKMYEEGVEVRHLNGDSCDNSWDNIAIGTRSDNMMDIPEQVRMDKALHATSFVKKHDKKAIKDYYSKYKSYKKTMEKFGITSKGTLHYILKGSVA